MPIKTSRLLIALIGLGVLVGEIFFVSRYLSAPHESIEVVGAYLLLVGSSLLLLGVWLLKGSSKYRFWFFLSLAVPAAFLLMIAYVSMIDW